MMMKQMKGKTQNGVVKRA